jgi:hypothetical protein
MGSAEIHNQQITIFSHIITYGNEANEALTEMMRDEIETMWNEPKGILHFDGSAFDVRFSISASFQPSIADIDIYQNTDPRNNYFRIEKFAYGNISFVDGLGCNTGYLLLENLYKGSTTAAHEYGHTLGLPHPDNMDIRGQGVPGIMYPRGTLVDSPYQYEPDKPAGTKGGTMFPIYRKVRQADIELLNIHKLEFENNCAVLGEFTSVWHDEHVKGENIL